MAPKKINQKELKEAQAATSDGQLVSALATISQI
jgi:hypothetical protein